MLSACSFNRQKVLSLTAGDTIPLRYADNLTLVTYSDYTVATLRNPWDTLKTLHTYILVPSSQSLPAHLPEGTIVRTPLRKSVIYSSVHCSLMESLGVTGSIGGVCDLKYIKLPSIQDGCSKGTIIDCGDGMNPDMEKIIELHPDAILLSPFENSGGYGRIEKLNIPIIECADYMETSALGRAEWMRFYGLLLELLPRPTAFLPKWIAVMAGLKSVLHFRQCHYQLLATEKRFCMVRSGWSQYNRTLV